MKNILLILVGDGYDTAHKVLGGIQAGGLALNAIPVVGQIASAAVEAGAGLGQVITGALQKKKAEGQVPPEQDVNQIAEINRLRRLRETYSTGAEASEYRDTLNRGLSAKMKAIAQQSGGGTGAIQANIVSANDNENAAYNQILATLEKNRLGVLGLEDQAQKEASQRTLDVQNMKYNQLLGSASGNLKTGQENTFSGANNLIDSFLNPSFMNLIHPSKNTPNVTQTPTVTPWNYNPNFPSFVPPTPNP